MGGLGGPAPQKKRFNTRRGGVLRLPKAQHADSYINTVLHPMTNNQQQQIVIETQNEIVLPNFYEGDYKGPTDFCNWVVPDRLLMGAYPKRRTILTSMLEAGGN